MKKILISILVAIYAISMFSIVNAASGSINASASVDKVKPGDTFKITVAGTADNNIKALQAKITYDETKLQKTSGVAAEGFSDVSGKDEIAIMISNVDNLSKSTNLYTITFKVLDTAAEGEAKIGLENVTLVTIDDESKQERIEGLQDSVTINIEKEKEEQPDPEQPDPEQPDPEQPDPEQPDPEQPSDEEDNTTVNDKEDTKLPQTGAETASVMAIIALGVVSIVSLVAYRRYKDI